MRHELRTEVTIDAPPALVWQILTDLDRYTNWNPFIESSEGRAVVGERLVNRIKGPGGRTVTFRPMVTEVESMSSFEWLGRLGIPGLFDGRHRFELRPTESGGTVLIHGEKFRGVLVPLFRRSLDRDTVKGFEAMNLALKERAEHQAASADGASAGH